MQVVPVFAFFRVYFLLSLIWCPHAAAQSYCGELFYVL